MTLAVRGDKSDDSGLGTNKANNCTCAKNGNEHSLNARHCAKTIKYFMLGVYESNYCDVSYSESIFHLLK